MLLLLLLLDRQSRSILLSTKKLMRLSSRLHHKLSVYLTVVFYGESTMLDRLLANKPLSF
jgi:hypothetical protein